MTSPAEGFMFNIKPTRVSLVGRPANKRKFLLTKSEEELETMDEVLQIIKEAKADGEDKLIEAMKASGKDTGTIDAAVGVYRLLSAFRDSMTEDDLTAMAGALKFEKQENVDDEEAKKAAEEAETKAAEEEAKQAAEEAEAKRAAEEAEAAKVADEANKNTEVEALKTRIAELERNTRRAELAAMVRDFKIGKTQDELVSTLEAVEKSGGDIEPVLETFRAAHNVIEQGLGEIGSDLPSDLNRDIYTKMEAAVERIMKEEQVTKTKAWELLDQREPALVAEYYK